MYLQAKAMREREFRYIAPHGGIACVFGMDGCIRTDAAVSCAVEVPDQRARFLNGAICFRTVSYTHLTALEKARFTPYNGLGG